MEDIWGPSDDDEVENEEGVQKHYEREGMVEGKWLRLAAEEVDGWDDDGDSKDEKSIYRRAHDGHHRRPDVEEEPTDGR